MFWVLHTVAMGITSTILKITLQHYITDTVKAKNLIRWVMNTLNKGIGWANRIVS